MKKSILAVLVLHLLACSNGNLSKAQNGNRSDERSTVTYPEKPVIKFDDNEDDSGPADFGLSIVAVSDNDSTITYKALSTWEKEDVGLALDIPKKEDEKGFGPSLHLRSIGPASDNLIRFMAKQYDQKLDSPANFTKDISVGYLNMNSFAKTLGARNAEDTTIFEYKLFFQGPNKDDYAELYLNINNRKKQIEIREKDAEYRPTLIRLLRKWWAVKAY